MACLSTRAEKTLEQLLGSSGLIELLAIFGKSDEPEVSRDNEARLYFDLDTQTLQISQNGSAYAAVALSSGSALGTSTSRVKGLRGVYNASNPTTQFDLSATEVVLRNPSNNTMLVAYDTATLTNNTSTAGPVANGRDQSGAFSNSSWIYLYFIHNGSTLATISSTATPSTGPTLPTGYTHFAFAGAIRKDGAGSLLKQRIRDTHVTYDELQSTMRVLSDGVATSFTDIDLSSFVPPIAGDVNINAILFLIHGTANVLFASWFRPDGSAIGPGHVYTQSVFSQVVGVTVTARTSFVLPHTSQIIEYAIGAVPSVSGGVFVDVMGYFLPNGG